MMAVLHNARLALIAGVALAASVVSAMADDSPCRQALALGLDVSGSVDAREYKLQLEGLAAALDHSPVRAALFALPETPVELLVYEWSGAEDQQVLIDWTPIRSDADLRDFREKLLGTVRRSTSAGTAIGQALQTGLRELSRRNHCWKQTLDISGDGKSNIGPEPAYVRRRFEEKGITINALVIGADAPGFGDLRQEEIAELSAYFHKNVISGADAFVQTALGYEEYAEAMSRKLQRELGGFVMSELRAPPTWRDKGQSNIGNSSIEWTTSIQ